MNQRKEGVLAGLGRLFGKVVGQKQIFGRKKFGKKMDKSNSKENKAEKNEKEVKQKVVENADDNKKQTAPNADKGKPGENEREKGDQEKAGGEKGKKEDHRGKAGAHKDKPDSQKEEEFKPVENEGEEKKCEQYDFPGVGTERGRKEDDDDVDRRNDEEEEGEKESDGKQNFRFYNRGDVGDFNNHYTNIFNKYDRSEPETDPTKPLPERSLRLTEFRLTRAIEENIRRLEEKRMALLVCHDDEVLQSMSYTIVNQADFKNYDKRTLGIDEREKAVDSLDLDIFTRGVVGKGEKMVVLIELGEIGFLESIFGFRIKLDAVIEKLTEKEIFLLCLVNASLMEKVPREKQDACLFHRWDIDFLPYLLEWHLPDGNAAETLFREVLAQRERGLWDKEKDDAEFRKIIRRYIMQGPQVLEEEVRKRREFLAKSGNPTDFVTTVNEVAIHELFTDREPHKTVLYVGTFFSDLSPVDFKSLVSKLLGNRKGSVEKENQKDLTLWTPIEDQSLKQEEVILAEVWENDCDKIMRECRLKVFRADDQSHYVQFASPYIKKEMKRYVQANYPDYLRKQYEIIRDEYIIFSDEFTANTIDNTIRLSVEMVIAYPTTYGSIIFDDFISLFRDYFHRFPDFEPENLFEGLYLLVREIERRVVIGEIYILLADLIREMLKHSEVRKYVTQFLDKLLLLEYYEAAFHVIWEVGKRLRFVPEFDFLYWLRKVLNKKHDHTDDIKNIRGDFYDYLMVLAEKSKFQMYDMVKGLRSWLPDMNQSFASYSPANKYALIFIYDYCVSTAGIVETSSYGKWPSKYPLFAPIPGLRMEGRPKVEAWFDVLVRWLLHPGIQIVFDKHFPKLKFNLTNALAELLEIWAALLLGENHANTPQEAQETFEILLGKIMDCTDKEQKKSILQHWTERQQIHRHEINGLSIREKEKRARVMKRYKIASYLINRYNKQLRRFLRG